MRWFAVLLVAGLIAACAAPNTVADPGPAPPAALVTAGGHLVTAHCAACHAIGVTGESPLAAAPPFRTLSQRYDVGMLEEALAEGVLTGHPAMPEFQFEPNEVEAIIAYLRSIQVREGGKP